MDLERAVAMFAVNHKPPVMGRTYGHANVVDFINDSFFNPHRFGETVMVLPQDD